MSKKTTLIFFLMTILYVVSVLVIVHHFFRDSLLFLFGALALAAAAYYLILIFYNYVLVKKLTLVLTQRCDPISYIELNKEYRQFYRHPHYPMLNESIGLMYLGKMEQAAILLDKIDPAEFVGDKKFLFHYYLNTFNINVEKNNLPLAEYYLTTLEDLLSGFNGKSLSMANLMLASAKAEMMRVNGESSQSRLLFQEILQRKQSRLSRMINCYRLGLVELELKQFGLAKSYFSEVAQDGGTLHAAALAKQKLEMLCQQNAE